MKKLIEIARSFSRKVSLPGYENMDFFASAKQECSEEEMEATSERLFIFCRNVVLDDIRKYTEAPKQKMSKVERKDKTFEIRDEVPEINH